MITTLSIFLSGWFEWATTGEMGRSRVESRTVTQREGWLEWNNQPTRACDLSGKLFIIRPLYIRGPP